MAATGDDHSEELDLKNPKNDDELPTLLEHYEIPTETVCESGDVIFPAGDGAQPALKIKVSSSLLSHASKVFEKMFSGGSAEAKALCNAGNIPTEMRIVDPPADLLLLCQLLHFQGDIQSTTHQSFLGLAVITQKYDFVKPLRNATTSKFAMLDVKYLGQIENLHYTAAACLLDDPKFFRLLTRYMVINYERGLPDPSDKHLDLLPVGMLSSIRAQRAFVNQEFSYYLSKFIEQYHTAAFILKMPADSFQFSQSLRAHELWSLDPRNFPFRWIFRELQEFAVPIMKVDDVRIVDENAPIEEPTDHPRTNRPSILHDFNTQPGGPRMRRYRATEATVKPPDKFDLVQIVDRIESLCVGICLDCLKDNEERRGKHFDHFSQNFDNPLRRMGSGGDSDYEADTEHPNDWESDW